MNNSILNIILLASVMLGGCAKEHLDFNGNGGKRGNKDGSIAFYPDTKNMMQTKGTPRDDFSAYKFVNVIMINESSRTPIVLTKPEPYSAETPWVSDISLMWPAGADLSFVAYASDITYATAGITFDKASIPTTITYNVPSNVTAQPDLLVATLPSKPLYYYKNAVVDIEMQHALACVSFCATSLEGKYIHKINIKWVAASGVYTLGKALDDKAWDITGANRTISFTAGTNNEQQIEAAIPSKNPNSPLTSGLNYLMNSDGYLMMVPQDLTGTGAQIEVWYSDIPNATDETSERFVYQIPEGTVWLPGKKYVYIMDEGAPVGAVVYYESYADGSLGLFYYNGMDALPTSSIVDGTIMDAGYGLLVPQGFYNHYNKTSSINMGVGTNELVNASIYPYGTDNIVATGVKFGTSTQGQNCVLYRQTQNDYPYRHAGSNSGTGICPTATNSLSAIVATICTDEVSITTYGKCLPHYARGVYNARSSEPRIHYIRTPMQMRNISYQTDGGSTNTIGNTYVQDIGIIDYGNYGGDRGYGGLRGNDVKKGEDFYETIVHGFFCGNFDGAMTYGGRGRAGGAVISKLKITNHNSQSLIHGQNYVALFAALDGGTLANLSSDADCKITNTEDSPANIAMFVGFNQNGTIRNVTNTATLTNNSQTTATWPPPLTGGIVGWNGYPNGKVIDCKNRGSISGLCYTGGIAAYNNFNGIVQNCENGIRENPDIVLSNFNTGGYVNSFLGGIVGIQQLGDGPGSSNRFQSIISNCKNYSQIIGGGSVGGIVGNNDWNWDWNWNEGNNTPFTAVGLVTMCVNYGNIESQGGNYGGMSGGIAGTNNGTIDHCQATGTISGYNAGGIVGYHTGDITDCIYYNSSSDSKISGTNAGGIVGHIVPAAPNYSESGYINRCLVLAVSPTSNGGGQTAGITPASGLLTGEYLFRYPSNGALGTNLDDNGKIIDPTIPTYCINNIFVLSGFNSGSPYNPSSSGISESTTVDVKILGPFNSGRYPLGINRLCTDMFSEIPFSSWYNKYGWKKGAKYPYVVEDISNYVPYINDGGGKFVSQLYSIASAIRNEKGSSVSYLFPSATLANTLRFDLFDMDGVPTNLTSISIDFTSVSFGTPGTATIKAPKGWKITSGLNGFGHGDPITGYYQYVEKQGTVVTMARQ